MTLSVAKLLRLAREKLEKGWTKGAFARNAKNEPVFSSSDEAVCYCLSGALRSIDPLCNARLLSRGYLRQAIDRDYLDIVTFNDTASSVEEVLAVVDKAILLAEADNA